MGLNEFDCAEISCELEEQSAFAQLDHLHVKGSKIKEPGHALNEILACFLY